MEATLRMLVFSKALVVDGTGSKPYRSDVLVEHDEIVAILPPGEGSADRMIDCSSLVLCPGFVDLHGHSELEVLRHPAMRPKIGQGITTEVAGNCGIGVFPAEKGSRLLEELNADVLGRYPKAGWTTFTSYRKTWEKRGSGTNQAFLQAHSTLRAQAMEGSPNRAATETEIRTMCRLLERSLKQGCFGFSTGLYYAPCIFAEQKELLALLSVVASYDRLFCVHIRCEGSTVLESLQEVIELARLSQVKLQVSHLKAIGKENQKLVPSMLSLIEGARVQGVDIQFDQYPYEYGSTSLFSLLPPEYLRLTRAELQHCLRDSGQRKKIKTLMETADGWDSLALLCGWDAIRILTLDSNPVYEGMTIAEVAGARNQGPYEAFFDLIGDEDGVALMTDVTQSQDSIKKILCHPLMCFGTDALYTGGNAHPRSHQAAIHLLDRYWKQASVLPLELLIAKMTGAGAKRLGLTDRGLVAKGYKADLVLFDPLTLEDKSDEVHPDTPCEGLKLVMVNGIIAFEDGRFTDRTAGTFLACQYWS